MSKLAARSVPASHALAAVFAIAWMYSSHEYDCLNIGPCSGNATTWDAALTITCCFFLVSWVAVIVVSAVRSKQMQGGRLALWLLAFGLPPIIVFVAGYLLNLGVTATGG